MLRLRTLVPLLLAVGAVFGGCSTTPSPPAGPSTPTAATPVVQVTGASFRLTAPAGWGAQQGTGTWDVARVPADVPTAGVSLLSGEHYNAFVAIAEHPLGARASLTQWETMLRSSHVTDYAAICGSSTSVQRQSLKVAGVLARLDAFTCPDYQSVDAVVTLVSDGYGLVVTCHPQGEVVSVAVTSCRRWLSGLILQPNPSRTSS